MSTRGYAADYLNKDESFTVLQQNTVRGNVKDGQGVSMPGVNVVVSGTQRGVVTDFDGNFSIEAQPGDVLVLSYVGYVTQNIEVASAQSDLEIVMKEDMDLLDEVVVVGYGTQVRKEITGSVSSLNEESFSTNTNSNVDDMILGKASGVQIVKNSGEPGGGMSVNIRGVGSINAGSSPLYVIDGVPIDNSPAITSAGSQISVSRTPRNPISFLNPSDIESIDILKDASATAIYGARGANGVVMITTKKGKSGQLAVDYSTQVGFNRVHQRLDLLNAEQYRTGINALIDAGNGTDVQRVAEFEGNGTDWQDVVFNDAALFVNHNFNFSWGNETTTYMASINNTREEGLVKNSKFNRYSARFNLNHRTDKVHFGISSTTSYIKDNFIPNGITVNSAGGAINAAKLWDPTLPVRDEEGNFTTSNFYEIDNPRAIISGNHITGNRYRSLVSVFLEYFFLPNLSAKVNVGTDINNEDKSVYKDRTTIIGKSLGGVATAFSATQSNYLVEGTINYNQEIKDHSFNLLAGITTQKYLTRYNEQQANNFPTDATGADNFGLADRSTLVNSSSKYNYQLLSYLGRLNYKFKDKYLLTATYRIDGSSRFGEGKRFGFFPSVSAGWLIDQESFLDDSVFNTLKLRASWGQTGNQEIGNYQALSTYNVGDSYVIDNQFVTVLNPERIANPDLKWETTEQIDIGVDFGLFRNRISGSLAWYKKKTKDMLLDLPIPSSTGFNSQYVNIGSMENHGVEFMVNSYNIDSDNFKWSSNFNFSTIRNKVLDLGGIEEIYTGGLPPSPSPAGIIVPGKPLMSFYGYEVLGIWQEGDDFSSVSNNVQPGDFKFRDINNDGIINTDDRVILGNSFPKFQWGFTNDITYKNFNLNFMFTGVEGVKMVNGNLIEQYFPISGLRSNRFRKPFLNRWTPENPTNDQPSYLNNDRSQAVNSRTVVDGAYIKLQSVRLSYNFSDKILKDKLRSLQVYVSGLNLFTLSDYEGFDPALNPYGVSNFNVDWNGYPSATTFLMGLKVGF
ncbi:SusC/RagA family TonB-linked outer membrane protein [Sinomicrobium soli]|uniref:SusC/RagA family TonB-linked outer membrane protein n=1 Tax=Sinomicrobium sp. N-1-3-6 TaxID=2219864 RepID=UPI0013752325|nr:TonB-dependent receptor [Sinomicrobium sp. N-1-3-6]